MVLSMEFIEFRFDGFARFVFSEGNSYSENCLLKETESLFLDTFILM